MFSSTGQDITNLDSIPPSIGGKQHYKLQLLPHLVDVENVFEFICNTVLYVLKIFAHKPHL